MFITLVCVNPSTVGTLSRRPPNIWLIIKCGQMVALNRCPYLISNLVRTTRFWNNLHQVTLKIKRLESQIILTNFVSKNTNRPKQKSENNTKTNVHHRFKWSFGSHNKTMGIFCLRHIMTVLRSLMK
jgi:hypothetical protein